METNQGAYILTLVETLNEIDLEKCSPLQIHTIEVILEGSLIQVRSIKEKEGIT